MTSPSRDRRLEARWWLAVLGLAFVGLVLRAWNLDWDKGQHWGQDGLYWSGASAMMASSPDPPRHGTVVGPLLDWLDGQRSPANPYRGPANFYHGGGITLAAARAASGLLASGADRGTQPAALVVHVVDFLGVPLLDADGVRQFNRGWDIDIVARLLGAIADSVAIVVIALIGRRLGGPLAGVAAAGFQAFSVIAIQHAHYVGAEPWLVLGASLCVLATIRMHRGGHLRTDATSAFIAGLAAGATVAVKLSGAGVAAVPLLGCAFLAVSRRRVVDWLRLGSCVLGAVVAFRVLNPAAFNGLGLGPAAAFWNDARFNLELTRHDFPWQMGYASRVPVVEALCALVSLAIGPGTTLAAVAGAVLLVRRRRTIGRWRVAGVVGAVVGPLLLLFVAHVQWPRYAIAMLPGLHACAGYGLAAGVCAARRWWAGRSRGMTVAASASIAVCGGLATLWGVAYVAGVYGHEHTRLTAARWVVDNVSPGSVIATGPIDNFLPLPIANMRQDDYAFEEFDPYPVDSVAKVELIAAQLSSVDFVIEESPRDWRSVARIPARYPSTIRLFDALDTGALGFTRVATITSPPRLGPLRLDGLANHVATFSTDHPEVRIWQRVRDVPHHEVVAVLDPVAAANALPVRWHDGHANGAMMYEGELAANDSIGTYVSDFDVDGNAALHAIGWLLILHVVGAATFAILAPMLRRLPDAGAGMAPTVGIVVVAFGVFVAVAWLGIPYTRGVVAGVAGLWTAGGAWCVWRRRSRLRHVWRRRRGDLLRAEVVMLVSFGLWLALRASNPDDSWHPLSGSEKPFELAVLTSLLRTRTLPPYDVWFAGGSLNYYYGGSLMLAVPARLLRTAPAVALNLGVPFVGMLAAGAAYTAGSALAAIGQRVVGAFEAVNHRFNRRAGLFAVAFVLLVPSAAILKHLVQWQFGEYDWLSPLYVFPGMGNRVEFPAVALLSFNVHAHLLDLAVLLTLLAAAGAWFESLRSGGSMTRVITLGALVGLLVGMTQVTNSWDFPLAVVLATLAALGALVPPVDVSFRLAWRARWRAIAASGAAAVAVVVVGWAPYWWRTEQYSTGLTAAETRTPFAGWVAHWGILAAATAVGVLDVAAQTVAGTVSGRLDRRRAILIAAAAVAVGVVGVVAVEVGRAAQLASVGLAVGCAAAAWMSRRIDGWSAGPPTFVVAAVGWGIVGGIESYQLEGDFGGRFNTVFKGWFGAWVVIAVAVAVIVASLVRRTSSLESRRSPRRLWFGAATSRAIVVLASVATVMYIVVAVPDRLESRVSSSALSLDGLSFLAGGAEFVVGDTIVDSGEDRLLIEWLQHNVAGTPTIAEAPGVSWTWSSRFSTLTGLPTVIGWKSGHEYLQRRGYWGAIDAREADMNALYESGDPALITSVLQRYDIRYVVFGTLERALAGPAGRAALTAHPCLHIGFAYRDLFIAEVDHRCVNMQPGALPRVQS
jgi:YYY domain-containing protein